MGPYLSKQTTVYRCPSDTVLATIQHSLGWRNRARSYSMNGSVGNIGDLLTNGVNPNNPDYVQFFKLSSVPIASKIFVFTEEHPDTISDGYFFNRIDSEEWYRLPASYHNGAGNFSFTDGHAELHRWQNSWTKPPSQPEQAFPSLWVPLPANQQADFNWLADHTSVEGPASPASAW
jgi:prepilin-type processing-associated H-X9-DG protein